MLTDDNEWCVSASAYRFLQTLSRDHAYSNDDGQMVPCCGHIMPADNDRQAVLIGCPNGIDFDISHHGKQVYIRTEGGKTYVVPFLEYKNAVLSFASRIEDFYDHNPPRKFEDEYEKNGFDAFKRDFDALKCRKDF